MWCVTTEIFIMKLNSSFYTLVIAITKRAKKFPERITEIYDFLEILLTPDIFCRSIAMVWHSLNYQYTISNIQTLAINLVLECE